jgi:hypothetical protein
MPADLNQWQYLFKNLKSLFLTSVWNVQVCLILHIVAFIQFLFLELSFIGMHLHLYTH